VNGEIPENLVSAAVAVFGQGTQVELHQNPNIRSVYAISIHDHSGNAVSLVPNISTEDMCTMSELKLAALLRRCSTPD
jgi:hypothetical protein